MKRFEDGHTIHRFLADHKDVQPEYDPSVLERLLALLTRLDVFLPIAKVILSLAGGRSYYGSLNWARQVRKDADLSVFEVDVSADATTGEVILGSGGCYERARKLVVGSGTLLFILGSLYICSLLSEQTDDVIPVLPAGLTVEANDDPHTLDADPGFIGIETVTPLPIPTVTAIPLVQATPGAESHSGDSCAVVQSGDTAWSLYNQLSPQGASSTQAVTIDGNRLQLAEATQLYPGNVFCVVE